MRVRARKVAVGFITTAMLAAGALVAQAGETPLPEGTTRLSGADRYQTSAAIARATFTAPVDTVFVATGEEYPDALAGGPLAARLSAPVLLVEKDRIRDAVRKELARMTPSTVYVLGGSAAISDSVVDDLSALTSASVHRLSGSNRYETAVDVSQEGWTSSATVFLSSGKAFPDALGGGAAAAHEDAPLLLTDPGALTRATRTELARLDPSTVYVLGGTAAVSGTALSAVKEALPATKVVRVSGADRYATSAAIARRIWASGSDSMFFASGKAFPDALSGTTSADVNGAPLLLTGGTCLTSDAISVRTDFDPSTRALLGGTAAIADGAIDKECGANRYTGSGDDVIAIKKPGGADNPALVTATHNGTRNFIVWGLDPDLDENDLLVNVIGDYRGTTMLDDNLFGEASNHISVHADGSWTISIKKLSAARALNSSSSGQGDDVLAWRGSARVADVTHDGAGNLIVWALDAEGDYIDLLVNEIGRYSGGVKLPLGTRYLTVQADGGWTIELR